MTSTFPPQLAALATEGLARSALPNAPVLPARPAKPPRRLFRRKSTPERLALDLQALVDAGLVEFRDEAGVGVRRYVLSPRGLELIVNA